MINDYFKDAVRAIFEQCIMEDEGKYADRERTAEKGAIIQASEKEMDQMKVDRESHPCSLEETTDRLRAARSTRFQRKRENSSLQSKRARKDSPRGCNNKGIVNDLAKKKKKNSRATRTVKTDNRRMTGNVNIYICSEAKETAQKVEEKSEVSTESSSDTTTEQSGISSDKLVASVKSKRRKSKEEESLDYAPKREEESGESGSTISDYLEPTGAIKLKMEVQNSLGSDVPAKDAPWIECGWKDTSDEKIMEKSETPCSTIYGTMSSLNSQVEEWSSNSWRNSSGGTTTSMIPCENWSLEGNANDHVSDEESCKELEWNLSRICRCRRDRESGGNVSFGCKCFCKPGRENFVKPWSICNCIEEEEEEGEGSVTECRGSLDTKESVSSVPDSKGNLDESKEEGPEEISDVNRSRRLSEEKRDKKGTEDRKVFKDEQNVRGISEEQRARRISEEQKERRTYEEEKAREISEGKKDRRISEEARTRKISEGQKARKIFDGQEDRRSSEEGKARKNSEDLKAREISEEQRDRRISEVGKVRKISEDQKVCKIFEGQEDRRSSGEGKTRKISEGQKVRKISAEQNNRRTSEEVKARKISEDQRAQKISEDRRDRRISEEVKARKISEDQRAQKISEEQKARKISGNQRDRRISEEEKARKVSEDQKSPKISEEQKAGKISEDQRDRRISEEEKARKISEDQKVQNLSEEQGGRRISEEEKARKIPEDQKSPKISEEQKARKISEDQRDRRISEEEKARKISEDQKIRKISKVQEVRSTSEEEKSRKISEGQRVRKISEWQNNRRTSEKVEARKISEQQRHRRISEEGKASKIPEDQKVQKLSEEQGDRRISEEEKFRKISEDQMVRKIWEEKRDRRISEEEKDRKISEDGKARKLSEEVRKMSAEPGTPRQPLETSHERPKFVRGKLVRPEIVTLKKLLRRQPPFPKDETSIESTILIENDHKKSIQNDVDRITRAQVSPDILKKYNMRYPCGCQRYLAANETGTVCPKIRQEEEMEDKERNGIQEWLKKRSVVKRLLKLLGGTKDAEGKPEEPIPGDKIAEPTLTVDTAADNEVETPQELDEDQVETKSTEMNADHEDDCDPSQDESRNSTDTLKDGTELNTIPSEHLINNDQSEQINADNIPPEPAVSQETYGKWREPDIESEKGQESDELHGTSASRDTANKNETLEPLNDSKPRKESQRKSLLRFHEPRTSIQSQDKKIQPHVESHKESITLRATFSAEPHKSDPHKVHGDSPRVQYPNTDESHTNGEAARCRCMPECQYNDEPTNHPRVCLKKEKPCRHGDPQGNDSPVSGPKERTCRKILIVCNTCCRPRNECRSTMSCGKGCTADKCNCTSVRVSNDSTLYAKSMICLYCDNPRDECACRSPAGKCSCCELPADSSQDERTVRDARPVPPGPDNDRLVYVTAWKPREDARRCFAGKPGHRKPDPVNERCRCEKLKPLKSQDLPYQRLTVFSDVMDELQHKIGGPVRCTRCRKIPCRCDVKAARDEGREERKRKYSISPKRRRKFLAVTVNRSNGKLLSNDRKRDGGQVTSEKHNRMAVRCACNASPCDCGRSGSKKPRAKCYYCKSSPCTCTATRERGKPRPCRCIDSPCRGGREKEIAARGKTSTKPKNNDEKIICVR